eukprot:CAMPEP_0174852958 /NCGR_PEP_ID=MMETSP1114-20130205/27289_1 /TAXON_ID=312471 /ORGANISM="Neobodo designis, Strain CCAP 1951/1" /LENGTH=121 /DNA_ID=CAMNT_0016087579 /DNA_START=55 /DNA_END=416 /DNA_ORIENTATION=+
MQLGSGIAAGDQAAGLSPAPSAGAWGGALERLLRVLPLVLARREHEHQLRVLLLDAAVVERRVQLQRLLPEEEPLLQHRHVGQLLDALLQHEDGVVVQVAVQEDGLLVALDAHIRRGSAHW